MAHITTCIFDLDGVICDTAKFHYQAWKRLSMTFGFDLTHEHDELLKGIGRAESLDRILGWAGITGFSAEEKAQLCDLKNTWFVECIQTITPADILPGIVTFMNEVKAAGLKIALGSASRNAPVILEKLRVTHYFDAIVDGNTPCKPKPNPDIFLHGATLTGSKPAECVVFEDAVSGVEAALAGGMYVIGIGSDKILTKAHICVPNLEGFTVKRFADL